MNLSSEILSNAAKRLLIRLDNTTDKELILALKACEDHSLSYAFYGDIPSWSEYVTEKHKYHLSIINFAIVYKNAVYNIYQNTAINYENIEASNDDAYELAA